MQQLNLDDNNIIEVESKNRFWRRQFQEGATKSQIKFDWFFGVIMPVICFVFDPTVFKGNAFGTAILGTYKPFAYLLSFVLVMAMSAWLIWGAKLKWLNGFLAGLFLVGGLISFTIGVFLFPFSLMGLIILIGVLGFTPLFTSIVFLRNSFRVFQTAKPVLDDGVLIRSFALAAIFSTVVPAAVNVEINKLIDEMKDGDAQRIWENAQTLKYISPLVNLDKIVLPYHRTAPDRRNTERVKAIADAHQVVTGEDIETKTRILMD